MSRTYHILRTWIEMREFKCGQAHGNGNGTDFWYSRKYMERAAYRVAIILEKKIDLHYRRIEYTESKNVSLRLLLYIFNKRLPGRVTWRRPLYDISCFLNSSP